MVMCTRSEQDAADGGSVGEDAHGQHHDNTGRHLRTHAELVTEVHEEGRDDDIRQEAHDEDPVVEPLLHQCPEATEDRVQRGHDGNGQIRLQPQRNEGMPEDADGDADQEPDDGDHGLDPPSAGTA